jgi:RNA polymerase sigma-70 factor (ECF subfamily)
MLDEATLLAGLRHRDAATFATFFDAFADRIYRLALGMVGNAADAEEIVQATFLAVYEGIDRFEPRARFSTWVYRIAFNQTLLLLRRRQPEVALPDETEAFPQPNVLIDWHMTPEDEALHAEASAMLHAAVQALPEFLRMAFVLRDIEQLSTAECALIQGITAGACKVRLHRARLLLRERLSHYFSERVTPSEKENV